jgi:hypothetical protein
MSEETELIEILEAGYKIGYQAAKTGMPEQTGIDVLKVIVKGMLSEKHKEQE